MKNIIFSVLFFVGYFLLIGKAIAQTNQVEPFKTDIRIDPDYYMAGAASMFFKSVRYIPLETTKESYFGKIDQLEITKDFFIIYDIETSSILFFNKDGSYHHKIKNFSFDEKFSNVSISSTKQTQFVLESFSVDPISEKLYIRQNRSSNFLYVFSFKGERIEKLLLPARTKDYFIFENGDSLYCQFRPRRLSDTAGYYYHDIIKRSPTKNSEYFFPVNLHTDALLTDLRLNLKSFYKSDERCIYLPEYSTQAIEWDAGNILGMYNIIFPQKYSLPLNFATDSAYTNKRLAFLSEKNLITHISQFIKIGDNILFEIRGVKLESINQDGPMRFLYNLKKQRLVLLNKVSSDRLSSHLPFLNFQSPVILGEYASAFFLSQPSINVFSSYNPNYKYSAPLTKYFKTQSNKSNPVLIEVLPKDIF